MKEESTMIIRRRAMLKLSFLYYCGSVHRSLANERIMMAKVDKELINIAINIKGL
jgi:hypothetical protein